MNKKIFTLLATSLLLFAAVFAVNAQWIGDEVDYLPDGIGGGAYHLHVTGVGVTEAPTNYGFVLGMDDYGYLKLQDWDYYARATPVPAIDSSYIKLRQTLWCVDVKVPEVLGQRPSYRFLNKEYGAELAVTEGYKWADFGVTSSKYDGEPIQVQQYGFYNGTGAGTTASSTVLVGGEYPRWIFSSWTYSTTPLEKNQYLRIELKDEPDYFLTFASEGVTGGGSWSTPGLSEQNISLVKVHARDFDSDSDFYPYLLKFTITSAAPRVLTAKDFNTALRSRVEEDYFNLSFTPAPTLGGNVFNQNLLAVESETVGAASLGYLNLLTKPGATPARYVTLLDGEDLDNYHNSYNNLYPKIGLSDTIVTAGESDFRLVYYPSEDSVALNVYHIDHVQKGAWSDPGLPYGGFAYDYLYDFTIWNNLIVRLQEVGTKTNGEFDRVITVDDMPNNWRVHFGQANCIVEDDRTTVQPNLYTIRDAQGRYLVMPLYTGDFSPQWLYLDENEVALKTPAYQWLVLQSDSTTNEVSANISRIHLVNREFHNVRLEYVQIYKTPHRFIATWSILSGDDKSVNYGPVNTKGVEVSVDGFAVVRDDAVAAQKKADGLPLTQAEIQKLYRTGEHLGYKYIDKDTLNWYGYALRYLSFLSNDYYFGINEVKNLSPKDSNIYVSEDETYFELLLPDNLDRDGEEGYGLGWDLPGNLTGNIYAQHDSTKDIAPLKRYYYQFRVNDYYKFQWNDNFLVLDDNARYVYTPKSIADTRRLRYAKFYLRFTYEVSNTEYYTLLDRIDVSNFHYFTDLTGLSITDTLRAYDDVSHGTLQTNGFGVVQASVDPYNLYVRAQVKTVGSTTVSAFALTSMSEPLYRRFDDAGLKGSKPGDEPEVVKIYRTYSENEQGYKDYLYEDQHSQYAYDFAGAGTSAYGNGVNYLGVTNNLIDNSKVKTDHVFPHHFAIYVDTAYVNRGTGWIKPQYLLAVSPQFGTGYVGCPTCLDGAPAKDYVYARYLRNVTDSARYGGIPEATIRDQKYIWETKWERLAFVNAIHAGDSLYILPTQTYTDPYTGTVSDPIFKYYSSYKADGTYEPNGNDYLNFLKLEAEITPIRLDNNLHKDEVFSFRFVDRQTVPGHTDDFYIESETTNRSSTTGRIIAPMSGGWIKIQNGVPVISRGSYRDAKSEAEIWNVEPTSDKPVANEAIETSDVTVVAGTGSVTILNASGKTAVISNILGQTIANTVLTSDQVTISAPKGIIIVTIEGENAVKAVVK
jgi:hypothetical protein